MVGFGAGLGKQGILSLSIDGATQLHKSFMPFIERGGLFVYTSKDYTLGDDVFLLLSLDGEDRIPVTGTVVWITPSGSQGSKKQGIGVQLADNSDMEQVRTKIETILAPYSGKDIPSDTM